MTDAARVRQSIATLRAEADALEAWLAELAANDAPAPADPASAHTPGPRILPPPPNPDGGLSDPKAFFDALKASDAVFGPKLTGDQVRGLNALTEVGDGRLPLAWMAYVLATAYHESGHVMVPVHERGSGRDDDRDGLDDYLERYDTGALAERLGNTPEADGDGVLYAGRGPVQITGRRNYAKATVRLLALGVLRPGESLLDTPDLALDLVVGAAISVFGMLEGWFTGKRLNDRIPTRATRENYVRARAIVNGSDRADLIAGYALAFEVALKAGGWR